MSKDETNDILDMDETETREPEEAEAPIREAPGEGDAPDPDDGGGSGETIPAQVVTQGARLGTFNSPVSRSGNGSAIPVDDLDTVHLGRQGENLTTEIVIDVSAWLDELPGATILLVALRPGEDELYTPIEVATDEGIMTWQITDVDTALAGNGRAELRAMKDGKIKKSAVFQTVIIRSLMGNGEPAQPLAPDWAQAVMESTAVCEAAAASARADATTAASAASAAQQAAESALAYAYGIEGVDEDEETGGLIISLPPTA